MDIDFEDSRLAMIETEAAADTRLPVAVIQFARHRLCILRAAPDLQTAKAWRSLGLQPTSTPERAWRPTHLRSLEQCFLHDSLLPVRHKTPFCHSDLFRGGVVYLRLVIRDPPRRHGANTGGFDVGIDILLCLLDVYRY